jgi:hypothetical protein
LMKEGVKVQTRGVLGSEEGKSEGFGGLVYIDAFW